MEPCCYVYAIENEWNGKVYVGITRHLQNRWDSHYSSLKKGIHTCRQLQRDWRLQKGKGFEFHVLQNVYEHEDGPIIERSWIGYYIMRGRAYNDSRPLRESQYLSLPYHMYAMWWV